MPPEALEGPANVSVRINTIVGDYQEALDGTINGIEPGSAINGQIQRTIELYGMGDQYSITAASGPAATVFARMPFGASSLARYLTRDSPNAFAVPIAA